MSGLEELGLTEGLAKKRSSLPLINPEAQFDDNSIPRSKLRLRRSLEGGDFSSDAFDENSFTVSETVSLSSDVKGGWYKITDTWAYLSADAPTFSITVPSDATQSYSPGMRIKLNQTTTKYFIITAVSSSTITVFGGTDYTLTSAAISDVYYSPWKAPLGFPLDPAKWSVEVYDYTSRSENNPTNNAWYNVGTTNSQISVPIGSWHIAYSVTIRGTSAAGTFVLVYATLSTTSNSETDTKMTTLGYNATVNNEITDTIVKLEKTRFLTVSSKTLYYLLTKVNSTSAAPTILGHYNTDSNGTYAMRLVAICAYV